LGEGHAVATAKQFKQSAAECLRSAAEAKTEEQRKLFLSMALAWTQAAMQAEGVLSPDMDEHEAPPIAVR
jgi:ubiquinone biosynthesis protein UbiJ